MMLTRSALPQRSPMPLIVPCTGVQQRLDAGVVLRADAFAPRHSERGDAGVLERQLADFLEKLEVLRVRQRVTALDEVHAQLIEPLGDEQLVLQRKIHAFALAAV